MAGPPEKRHRRRRPPALARKGRIRPAPVRGSAPAGGFRCAHSRWGDCSSINIDPVDDCTFWYVNEYYTAAGQASSTAGWQTRTASFKFPGCTP